MALRQLVLRKKIDELNKQLVILREKDAEFETRAAALATREAELEAALEEITEETPDEDRTTFDESVAALEADQKALEEDKTANETDKAKLEAEIQKLQAELDDISERTKTPPPTPPANANPQTRKDDISMNETATLHTRRALAILGSSHQERAAFVAQPDVKDFLQRIRTIGAETRAVTNAELGIPTVMLELLRDNLYRYSKLITKVTVRTVNGKARQNISGAVPEGVWMEMVGALNELALTYNQVEVDGYMVGGFIPVARATLDDSSDINLAADIMDKLGQAIGLALDKAILYGKDIKMPLGILTRLAQTSQPSDWYEYAPAWTDLHASNLLKFDPSSMTPETFFATLITNLGVAEPDYAVGGTFWAMNRKTRMALLAKAVTFNAAGALVAGLNNTMPIEGGDIVELPFIPDNDIVGGYGSLYLLAEREDAMLETSDHARFTQHQRVFKGWARYDGMPIFGEAFVAVNIANSNPTTSILFAQDIANTVATPKALPIAGTYSGTQIVALTCDTPDAQIYYTVDGSEPDATKTAYNGPITVAATTTIKAIAYKTGLTPSAVLTAAYTITA